MRSSVPRCLVLLVIFWFLGTSRVAAFSLEAPEQIGLAVTLGSSYDPQPTFSFAQLSLMALYDYEQIMSHRAPEALRFKLEGNLGLTDHSPSRLLVSANFFALYYLRKLGTETLRPYVEAGAGVAYSDFQVDGQGMRFNFNPQAGFGAEWHTAAGSCYYGAIRIYHLSNGGLHHDNRGINAVTLQLGRSF